MENKDSTETYLNLGSEQFNTWIKEFEQKYNKLEEKSNINNFDSFTNSDIISDEISDNILEESSDEESESVFVKNPNTESSSKKKILFSKYKTSIRKSNPKSTESNLKEEFKNANKQNTNKQKTTLSESVSSEKFNQPIKLEEEIISLKELNLMIPDKFAKETNNEKVDRQNNNFFVNENVQKKNKLGDTALYKFISNRRR